MRIKALFLALAVFAVAIAGAQTSELSVKMTQTDGLKVISAAVGEIVFGSRLIAIEPPWARIWFHNPHSPMSFVNEGNFAAATQEPDNGDKFTLTEYSATVNGSDVTVKFSGKMAEELPAGVEYTMLMIADFALAGSDYSATHKDGTVSTGHIAAEPLNSAVPIIVDAVAVEFSGAFGSWKIAAKPGLAFNVADRRGTAALMPLVNCFWVGHMLRELPFGEEYSAEFTLSFEPRENAVIPKPLDLPAPTFPLTLTPMPAETPARVELPTYMPIPKKVEITGTLDAKAALPFAIGSFKNVPEEDIARLTKAISPRDIKMPTRPINIKLVEPAAEGALANAEGYILEVTRKAANITAVTPRGAFYAIQTLKAMPQDQTYRIEDYPDLAFRSAHMFANEETDDFHRWLVDNLFTRYKYNAIILEIEFAQWESAPELWRPRSATKEQLRSFLAHCKDNYIEVIPLFQTLGHMGWLFYNDNHLEMAEDPATPYAYNPSHPAVYPLMDAILEEVFELFDSDYLHIGHDEITMRGTFPYQPENVAKGIQQVVLDDIMHYYDMCKKRGKRIMIWHDMILTGGECPNASGMHISNVKETFRDLLPRDIIIADWQYNGDNAHAHYRDVKLLKEEGFDVIGCTWFEPNNIENFTRAVHNYDAMGMMATTWSGLLSGWDSFKHSYYQMATYPRLGAWAWTVSDENYAKHGNFHDVLADILAAYGKPNRRTVDITPVTNILIDESANPFLTGHVFDLPKSLPVGNNLRIGDIEFKLPQHEGVLAAVALRSGKLPNFPSKVVLPVAAYADKLFLLQSHIDTIMPEFDRHIANITLIYNDSTKATTQLRYGRNIGTLFGETTFYLGKHNRMDLAGNARLWYTEWANPFPERQIVSIEIESAGLPYFLFALSIE